MFVLKWFELQQKFLKNSYRQNKLNFFLRDLWHGLIFLGGLALLYLFLVWMFSFIHQKGYPAFEFALILASFSLLIFLPLVYYSAIITSLTYLFQKEEIHFYFSLPVKRISIFAVKFLQTYLETAWMIFLAFITFLIAFQNYFNTSPMVYLTGSIAYLIYLFIPVCLAVTTVILVSRYLPFIKAKGILTVIGLLVGSLLVTAIRVMQPEKLATSEGKLHLITFLQTLHRPWMTLLPSEWVTNILFAQTRDDFRGIFFNFAILFGAAAILAVIIYFLAKNYFARIWAEAEVVVPAAEKKFSWEILLNIFPKSLHHFIRKDLLNIYRDTVEKGSLLILIPLVFVYLFSMYVLGKQLQSYHVRALFSYYFLYVFNFFYSSVVIAGLAGRFVFPSVSLEANNFYLIKSSPASLREFIKAKFLLGFIPLLFMGEILILSSSYLLKFPFLIALISAVVMGLLCWGMTMIPLILGIWQADFSIRESLEFILSYRGFLCFVWECVYIAVIILLIAIPSAIFLPKGFSQIFILFSAVSLVLIGIIVKIMTKTYELSIIKLAQREF